MPPGVDRLRCRGGFHLAGIAHQKAPGGGPPGAERALATLQLARQSAAAGVKCFVFSSVKAMGPQYRQEPGTESDCTAPTDPYGWSKWRAGNALLADVRPLFRRRS